MSVPIQVREKVAFHRDIYRSLVKGLLRQKDSGEFCDVVLSINGHNYFAHKAVLAAASPYFQSMFTSHMKEQSSTEVDLTESLLLENDDSFRHILNFIYCGEIDITTDNVEDALRIADFLLLEDVKEYCRQFYIQYGNLNLSNCISVSILSEHHNLLEVDHIAKAMVKSRFHDYLIHSEDLLDIPVAFFSKLLKDPEVTQFTSNDNLVKGILKWMKCDRNERQKYLLKLLSSVCLQSLTVEIVEILLDEQAVQSDHEFVTQLKAIQSARGDVACRRVALELAPCHRDVSSYDSAFEKVDVTPVVIAANCHPGFHYIKVLVYSIEEERWYQVPVSNDAVMHALPPRLNVCSICLHDSTIYMFLCHSLPYPSDILRVYVMALCVETGQHTLYTYRHFSNQSQCCQTTLTDDPAIPPVFICCHGFLCIVGNCEGAGQVFLCDPSTQTYVCYQIPGVRFVSLARAVVRDDRFLYIWCRHRLGHEEYCINKEIAFVRFDCKHKSFNNLHIPTPPGIWYAEFADPHIMTLEDDRVIIHIPGRTSLILDETQNEWLTFHKKVPHYPVQHTPRDMPYNGREVYTALAKDVYVLQNPVAYTTSMVCLQESSRTYVSHPPPPVDCISLATSGHLKSSVLHSLVPCEEFDDTYTHLIHNKSSSLDYDTEESGTGHSPSDSDIEYEYDGYEYDDEIYGYYEEEYEY